ncbi:MAG: response regulator receiver domain/Rubrerythrin [Deltaproteobacteria bacterium]|nr:response regulator receiver domain/Rubrerythrin [Deltaproteobacteria bacterium]
MRELINWLAGIEDRTSKVYEKAASIFQDDSELSDFLRHLAGEEKIHYEYMCKAAELLNNKDIPSIVALTDSTKKELDPYYLSCEARIKAKTLNKKDLIDFMVSTEFSEWNQLFLYVINTLKHEHREFIPMATGIQQHKRSIERFIESQSGTEEYIKRLRSLPAIWREKILVVDDTKMVVDLLQAIFIEEGDIEIAANGKEGIKKIGEKYFAVIISDVDMPVMNGIEFYNQAVEMYPNIKERFLFFTSSFDNDRLSFFRENNIRYLQKPSSINNIVKALVEILGR